MKTSHLLGLLSFLASSKHVEASPAKFLWETVEYSAADCTGNPYLKTSSMGPKLDACMITFTGSQKLEQVNASWFKLTTFSGFKCSTSAVSGSELLQSSGCDNGSKKYILEEMEPESVSFTLSLERPSTVTASDFKSKVCKILDQRSFLQSLPALEDLDFERAQTSWQSSGSCSSSPNGDSALTLNHGKIALFNSSDCTSQRQSGDQTCGYALRSDLVLFISMDISTFQGGTTTNRTDAPSSVSRSISSLLLLALALFTSIA